MHARLGQGRIVGEWGRFVDSGPDMLAFAKSQIRMQLLW